MTESVNELNRKLAGFTTVIDLEMHFEQGASAYDLKLVLSNDQHNSIVLRCHQVSDLWTKEFGGGLTQFMVLRAEDISGRQLDRKNLLFSDLEHERIRFDCLSAELEPL